MRKLSELIREGAKLRPQTIRQYFGEIAKGEFTGELGSCALGAAYEAITGLCQEDVSPMAVQKEINTATGINIGSVIVADPTKEWGGGISVRGLVTVLNDYEFWTREDIAAYLEKVGL